MMDLQRPDGCTRMAHWCTGDLSGRLLESLSCSDGVDGKSDPRLSDLFERILKQRRPSGLFGRYAGTPKNGRPEDNPLSGADRLFCGLIRYYERTGDCRAIESAEGVAKRLLSLKDSWHRRVKASGGKFIAAWVTEPMARLYAITKDQRYLDFCKMFHEHLGTCATGSHAHGFMSTLRGLQIAAMVTGDITWNKKPEENRQLIIDKHLETPDGCTPEAFPWSPANEGCSIADWLMLNLNAGLISNEDSAYEKAERILWNALALNQWINGGFGHRALTENGYGMARFEEAWWCCVHHATMAISELARHVVTFKDNTVRVNFLMPGKYALLLPDGRSAEVVINTRYPAVAEATIEAKNLPPKIPLRVRVPGCITEAKLSETHGPNMRRIGLKGRLGHRIEKCHSGVVLTYGPLVLAPSIYVWNSDIPRAPGDHTIPSGYVPESMPPGIPTLKVGGKVDGEGFVQLSTTPLPAWSYFDEGPGARCWIEGAAVNVPVKFSNGAVKKLRFSPLCYNTSNLTLCETPVVFRGVEN